MSGDKRFILNAIIIYTMDKDKEKTKEGEAQEEISKIRYEVEV